VRRALIARVILVLAWLLGVLPFGVAAWLGRIGASLAFRFGGSDVARGLEHLAIAFPQTTEVERVRILRDSFMHLGLTAVEAFQYRRLDPRRGTYIRFTDRARQAIETAHASGTGIVGFTGHIGSWEQFARGFGFRWPFKAAAVAAEMLYPELGRWAERYRTAGGLVNFWRGRPGARDAMRDFLKDGGALGLLIDQDTRVKHVFVPFFGRLAATPRGGADFVVDTGALPLAIWDRREADGTHVVDAVVLDVPRTGDREADVLAITAAATKALEDAIRAAPEQWVWAHRRWKTRPEPT